MKPTTEEILEKRAALLNCSVELIEYVAILEYRIVDLENQVDDLDRVLEEALDRIRHLERKVSASIYG